MSRFQRRPEWAKIMIRVAIITIIIMIGLAAGVLLSGSSKTVKKISHAGKAVVQLTTLLLAVPLGNLEQPLAGSLPR
jgi:hypothetical protein